MFVMTKPAKINIPVPSNSLKIRDLTDEVTSNQRSNCRNWDRRSEHLVEVCFRSVTVFLDATFIALDLVRGAGAGAVDSDQIMVLEHGPLLNILSAHHADSGRAVPPILPFSFHSKGHPMTRPLTGILPVAPTPFHDDGSNDSEGMTRVQDCMIDQGVDAICLLANFSEQIVLSDAERAILTKVSLEHVAGRVPVIVTVSHFSTQIVVDRAREAEAMGAAMLMMMPPYHGVGLVLPEAGIFEHFAAVSDAVSVPIMVQDAPLSGVSLPVPLLVRMAKEIENVSYFKKEMPFAADKLAALIDAGGDHIVGPFDGEEAATLLADLDAGCTGTMTSALQSELIKPIVTHYHADYVDAALAQWLIVCR